MRFSSVILLGITPRGCKTINCTFCITSCSNLRPFFNRKSSKDHKYSCTFAQSEQSNLIASCAQTVQFIVLYFLTAFFWINAQAAPPPVVDLNDLPESNSNTFSTTTENTFTSSPDSSEPDPVAIRQTLPTDQRLRLLEQQIHNLTQMNLPAKVDNLEQQINQLNGEREEQAHIIQQLQEQLQTQSTAPSPKAANNNPAQSTAATQETDTSLEAEAPAAPPSLTETTVVEKKTITTSTPEDTGEKVYKTAFDLMMKKQNTQAIIAFKNFLENYPNSPIYTPNAYYWLGELYSTTHQNTQASKSFSLFIQQYPTHAKVPDAMMKLAIMRDEAGEHAHAKQTLQKIIQQFPQSNAAKLATLRLKEMQISTPS